MVSRSDEFPAFRRRSFARRRSVSSLSLSGSSGSENNSERHYDPHDLDNKFTMYDREANTGQLATVTAGKEAQAQQGESKSPVRVRHITFNKFSNTHIDILHKNTSA